MDSRIEDLTACADGRAEALNPFKLAADRDSWMKGFSTAVSRKLAAPVGHSTV